MSGFKFHRANFIFRLLCTISSLSIAVWIYAIKSKITLGVLNTKFLSYFNVSGIQVPSNFIDYLDSWWSYVVYFAIILGFAYWTIVLTKGLDYGIPLPAQKIKGISSAGEEMGLTYFGLFFYALSVTDAMTFVMTFIVLSIGLTLTSQHMFNPLYLFLGYKYYNVEVIATETRAPETCKSESSASESSASESSASETNISEISTSTLLVITKENHQFNDEVSFDYLYLLTPFTFIEIPKSHNQQ